MPWTDEEMAAGRERRRQNKANWAKGEAARVEGMRQAAQVERQANPGPWQQQPSEVIEALEGEVIVAPPEYPEPVHSKQEAHDRLAVHGVDEICDLIADGHSQREICRRMGVRPAHLNSWLDSQQAHARVRAARRIGAQAWLDRGFAAIDEATSLGDLAKAREISSLCRKYAQVLNPGEYSDRVQVDATIEQVDDAASIDAKLKLLMASIGNK